MIRPVRPSARAVLVEENRVLLNHLRHPEAGDWYEFPGGGIQPGETLEQAVVREAREETGYNVWVHELLWVRDYIAGNHPHGYLSPPGFQAVDFLFRCTLVDAAVSQAHELDDYQVGVEWVDPQRLGTIALAPLALVPRLLEFLADRTVGKPVYLGDVP